jgi:cytochrome P450
MATMTPQIPDEATPATQGVQARKPLVVREHKGFRYPPGLRRNLPFYIFSRFFRASNPILLFEYLQEEYGPISHYRLGPNHIVFVNDPEMIRDILINQAPLFIKERTQRRMKILLGEGLITSDGETHMRQRRIAAPAFHRQRIAAYGDMMSARAATMRNEWQQGVVIDAASEMMRLALQVVARTIFDTDVTEDVQTINTEVNAIMKLYNFLIALPRAEALMHLPIPGLMRFKRARKRLDAVVHRMIDQRRQSGEDRGDLLSMLLASRDEERDQSKLTDEQVRDEVTTIFLAGYETVANALAWTWMLLAQNPEAEAKMHAEIDAVLEGRLPTMADLPRLRYTEMVLSESMRLYPPAWAMGRQSTAPVEIGPYRLPKGTYFFFSQYIMQRTPEYFPDPLRFEPERFTPENKASRPKFAYFPFGGGNRQCIGESFAWMEAVLLTATIAQQWRLRLVPGQKIEVQPKITLRSKYPIRMIPERRA